MFVNIFSMEKVGEKLKALRLETGLSVRKFADLAGVEKHSYSNWEYSSKKAFLPVDVVEKLLPVFEQHGVDAYRVWEDVGGVTRADLLGQTGKDAITRQLPNGTTVTGIPAEIYTSASDTALARYVGPGLVVTAEIEGKDGPTVGIYEIGKDGRKFTLIPHQSSDQKPLVYQAGSDNWYTGSVGSGDDAGNCRITLVVREISTPHNIEYL